jgi:hypothetical protein
VDLAAMSRFFNANGVITFGSISAAIDITGAVTALAVWRITTTTDLSWQSAIETETSAAADSLSFGRRNTGNIYLSNATTASGGDSKNVSPSVGIGDEDNWVVMAGGKGAGTVDPFSHKVVIGGASTRRTETARSMANCASIVGGTIKIGGNADFLTGRIAVCALFNKVLSDAEVQGIASAKTTQSIYDLAPVWLVDDNDAFTADYMGNSGDGSKTNTADDADDPAGWVYGISAGGPTPPYISATVS